MSFFIAAGVQVAFIALMLIGPSAWLHSRGVRPSVALSGAMLLYGAVSMMAFWLAWILLPDQAAAEGVRLTVMTAGMLAAFVALAQGRVRAMPAVPILIMAVASLALLLWVHAGSDLASPLRVAAERWTHPLPGDNQIPFDFAEAFRLGHIASPLHGDWLSSDRPPLQTAMYMLTPGFLLWPGDPFAYQAAAVAFQMFALLGAWVLAQSMGAGAATSLLAVAAVAFMPMTLVNGAFVWPKLLPAGFLCLAAVYFGKDYPEDKASPFMGVLVGGAAAMAMLGHGSTAFVLIGMALCAAALGRWGNPRFMAAAVVAFAVLYAPWIAYQKFADPPGDRLLKWHLAGVQKVDSRPLGAVLRSAYSPLTLREIVARRVANVRFLAQGVGRSYGNTRDAFGLEIRGEAARAAQVLKEVRVGQFFTLVLGAGLLGLGLFCLPVLVAARQTRTVALMLVSSLLIWLVFLFERGQATIHQGSYFLEVALVTTAVVGISLVSRRLAAAVVALHVALTVFQYAW